MLSKALLSTIAYFDIFDFPLTGDELQRLLWKSRASLSDCLKTLGSMPEIGGKEGYFFLKERQQLPAVRKNRCLIAEKLWKKTGKNLKCLLMLPFVRMVAVGNTLAYNNPDQESDIDLLIIIDQKRLWLTRLLLTLLLHLKGVRRYGEKISGRFCLSFFLTESSLSLKPLAILPEDIYLIYWLATLQPVIGYNMYKKFIQKNQKWLTPYLPNFFTPEKYDCFYLLPSSKWREKISKTLNWILGDRLGNFFEALAKRIFKPRTIKKAKKLDRRASVIITDTILKFHNLDRRREFFRQWRKKVADLEK